MPRKAAVDDSIYIDEAEGFLLDHALFSPPRTWPPLPVEPSQALRLTANKRKMDWEDEVRNHPDEPVEIPIAVKKDGYDDANSERCVICLMALRDRTVVGVCGHEFCFECIGVWSNQSRRCPLCSADMAPFLLHDLDNSSPTKFYLPPLPQRKLPSASEAGPSRRLPLPEERARMEGEKAEMDELDIQVARRKELYEHELYAKHIGSNATTKFKPNPTPRQITEDQSLIQRATAFMRRELRVWSLVDVEFLTNYILSLLKAIDIRSEPAIRLLAEFLETPNGPQYPNAAEHFAHEVYSFLRSPFNELRKYDAVAQYDPIPVPRGRTASPASVSMSRSQSRSLSPLSFESESPRRRHPRSQSRSRSRSRSPLPPRDPGKRDVFVPPRSPRGKRWNEADTWLDPEYESWVKEERKRQEERLLRRRAARERRMSSRQDEKKQVIELLPSPPAETAPLRMDDRPIPTGPRRLEKASPVISIKGAAKAVPPARLALLEKLAKAKAEAQTQKVDVADVIDEKPTIPPLPHSKSDPTSASNGGVRSAVLARLRLKLKLASEKKSYVFNQNESRAQALRAQILQARARRQATETDAVLRHMDKLDRAREVRRRLMVAKMMAAETESERRARELKDKLMGEKKARMLKEQLKKRKQSQGEVDAGVGTLVNVVQVAAK